jgi:hypothetical protein
MMAEVTNIKIIGFDEERPPMIQTRPCVDLVFQLDQEAPPEWCKCFSEVTGKTRYPISINPEEGIFIETWVKKPEEIEGSLASVKKFVAATNVNYDDMQRRRRNVVHVYSPDVVLSTAQMA